MKKEEIETIKDFVEENWKNYKEWYEDYEDKDIHSINDFSSKFDYFAEHLREDEEEY